MYKLRPRQQESVDKIINFLNSSSKKNGLFVYPTSFGKSLVVASVADKFPDRYFILVTSSKELLIQDYQKYISYGNDAYLCSASLNSKDVGHVTFSTIGTIVKQIPFYKDKDVIILFDEAHLCAKKGGQLDKFVKQIKKVKLIGVTATPVSLSNGLNGSSLKMMNRDRKCIYNSIEDVVQIQEIKDKYWSKIIYDVREVDMSSLMLNTTGTDYTEQSITKFGEANDSINTCIREIKKLLSEGRKSILVSVPSIQQAKDIEAKFKECRALYSGINDKVRDDIIRDFKSFELRVVVQVRILTVGFDFPELDGIISTTPTNSLTFWYQFIGRGVRIHEYKKDCKVVDLSGAYKKFGKIEDLNIENIEGYGWGMFSGERLLTGVYFWDENVINKTELINKNKKKISEIQPAKTTNEVTLKLWFGKHNGLTCDHVSKKHPQYVEWMLTKSNFSWDTLKMKELKSTLLYFMRKYYNKHL